MLNLSKKIPKIFLFSLLGIYFLLLFQYPAYSNPVSELERQIAEKGKEIKEKESVLNSVEARIKEIGSSDHSLSQKINLITEEITILERNIEETEDEIEEKIKGIEEKQEQLEKMKVLIDEVSGDLYIQSRYKLVSFFLNLNNWSSIAESLYIKKSTISVLKTEVEKMGGEFSSLAESKAELDREKESLDKQREGLDEAHELLKEEKSKLQAELSKQIAAKSGLSAEITDLNKKVSQLQAALIAARSAGFVSSGGTTGSVLGTSISQAPAGSFGVFSIGAYTHRNGMSQWGAKARADAGQSVEQILSFYYPGTRLKTGTVVMKGVQENIMSDISVTGHGVINFEEYYLLGIKEMPESWPMEVLKAQAIAARTYAIRYTNNGRSSICATQSCQVFNLPLKTGRWVEAVNATKGIVLVNADDTPALTQYAAVHGGWVNNVGWDTESGTGNDWFNDSWERKSGVNWFYRSWYIDGSGYSGQTCKHSPWLSQGEMVDLINRYLIKNNQGVINKPDLSRLLPIDYGKCAGRLDYGRTDKAPYTSKQLKKFLSNPVLSVSTVSTALSNGSTTNVSFSTNRGIVNISGPLFKEIYNQTAPGHLRIQQQTHYAFFNVERS